MPPPGPRGESSGFRRPLRRRERDDAEQKYLLGSQAMTVLYPYVREVVSDLTTRGGFPPLILSPVNFDALYQQHLQKQDSKAAEAETETSTEVTH